MASTEPPSLVQDLQKSKKYQATQARATKTERVVEAVSTEDGDDSTRSSRKPKPYANQIGAHAMLIQQAAEQRKCLRPVPGPKPWDIPLPQEAYAEKADALPRNSVPILRPFQVRNRMEHPEYKEWDKPNNERLFDIPPTTTTTTSTDTPPKKKKGKKKKKRQTPPVTYTNIHDIRSRYEMNVEEKPHEFGQEEYHQQQAPHEELYHDPSYSCTSSQQAILAEPSRAQPKIKKPKPRMDMQTQTEEDLLRPPRSDVDPPTNDSISSHDDDSQSVGPISDPEISFQPPTAVVLTVKSADGTIASLKAEPVDEGEAEPGGFRFQERYDQPPPNFTVAVPSQFRRKQREQQLTYLSMEAERRRRWVEHRVHRMDDFKDPPTVVPTIGDPLGKNAETLLPIPDGLEESTQESQQHSHHYQQGEHHQQEEDNSTIASPVPSSPGISTPTQNELVSQNSSIASTESAAPPPEKPIQPTEAPTKTSKALPTPASNPNLANMTAAERLALIKRNIGIMQKILYKNNNNNNNNPSDNNEEKNDTPPHQNKARKRVSFQINSPPLSKPEKAEQDETQQPQRNFRTDNYLEDLLRDTRKPGITPIEELLASLEAEMARERMEYNNLVEQISHVLTNSETDSLPSSIHSFHSPPLPPSPPQEWTKMYDQDMEGSYSSFPFDEVEPERQQQRQQRPKPPSPEIVVRSQPGPVAEQVYAQPNASHTTLYTQVFRSRSLIVKPNDGVDPRRSSVLW